MLVLKQALQCGSKCVIFILLMPCTHGLYGEIDGSTWMITQALAHACIIGGVLWCECIDCYIPFELLAPEAVSRSSSDILNT